MAADDAVQAWPDLVLAFLSGVTDGAGLLEDGLSGLRIAGGVREARPGEHDDAAHDPEAKMHGVLLSSTARVKNSRGLTDVQGFSESLQCGSARGGESVGSGSWTR